MRTAFLAVGLILAILRLYLAKPEVKVSKQSFEVTGFNNDEKTQNTGRFYLQSKLLRWLPGDAGALASGILLGGDEFLSGKSVASFRRAGLSHITAASGYNVVVVSGWAMGVLVGRLGRKLSMYFGILCTILYMFLAGMTVPVIRAGVMVILTYTGLVFGRKTDVWWSLGLTTLGMIIYKPTWMFDISFQLSIAATIGVLLSGGGAASALILNFRTSLAAWILTLPIILHHFGQISLIAPASNVVIIWVVPVVMEVTALAVLIGQVWDGLGWLVALTAWPGLKFMLEATDWFATLPGASIEAGKASWGWVMGYYIVVGLIVVRVKKWQRHDY